MRTRTATICLPLRCRLTTQAAAANSNALTDLAIKFKDGVPELTEEDKAAMAARYQGEEPIFHNTWAATAPTL